MVHGGHIGIPGYGSILRARGFPKHPVASKALCSRASGLKDLREQASGIPRLHYRGAWMFRGEVKADPWNGGPIP